MRILNRRDFEAILFSLGRVQVHSGEQIAVLGHLGGFEVRISWQDEQQWWVVSITEYQRISPTRLGMPIPVGVVPHDIYSREEMGDWCSRLIDSESGVLLEQFDHEVQLIHRNNPSETKV